MNSFIYRIRKEAIEFAYNSGSINKEEKDERMKILEEWCEEDRKLSESNNHHS